MCSFGDLTWQVSTEEGDVKAREFGVMFIETSAKAGFNIKDDMVDVNLKPTTNSLQTEQQGGGCSMAGTSSHNLHGRQMDRDGYMESVSGYICIKAQWLSIGAAPSICDPSHWRNQRLVIAHQRRKNTTAAYVGEEDSVFADCRDAVMNAAPVTAYKSSSAANVELLIAQTTPPKVRNDCKIGVTAAMEFALNTTAAQETKNVDVCVSATEETSKGLSRVIKIGVLSDEKFPNKARGRDDVLYLDSVLEWVRSWEALEAFKETTMSKPLLFFFSF
ncbi:hypothetical protein ACH5RR_013146 [Cinchona calisaya]|uniref:Uncharacterized protein n=1 Tax=Cinchona calisaya TaxID=153742 RepID=A0ABD2ZZ72_9GENT